jgi:signal transduction histidine kinase
MSRAEHLATLGELAAGLAHEIRNPLAGIAGVVEVIGSELPAESAGRRMMREVRAEVDSINQIVSQLLEIARPKPPEMRFASLVESAEQALLFAHEDAASKSVVVELITPDAMPKVEHDPHQTRQVLLNLLLNAIQACEPGPPAPGPPANPPLIRRGGESSGSLGWRQGRVRIEFGHDADFVWAAVADNGCGIAPEILPNIFRPFYTTKGAGTGLGLPLVKRIVEDHGGRVEVESRPEQGSRFTVFLPRHRP